jgi:hypothetical protein
LPQALEEVIQRGLAAHRSTLSFWSQPLAQALEALAAEEPTAAESERMLALAAALAQQENGSAPAPENGSTHAPLGPSEIHLIERALQQTAVPPLSISIPAASYGLMTRDELGARLKQWLDDLPSYPALIDVTNDTDGHGD